MHSPESGPGGSKPDPQAFFLGVCSGGYLFSSGGPTPTSPRQFLPWFYVEKTKTIRDVTIVKMEDEG